MSSIHSNDQNLIEQIKNRILQLSKLPPSEKWTQKDYDFLGYFIEEKSGVRISLSTLKRIWKNENNRLPHISTLDALSHAAYEKDWLALKNDTIKAEVTKDVVEPLKKKKPLKKTFWSLGILGLLVLCFFGFKYFNTKKDVIKSTDVHFSARTSVDNRVPNSVVFDYDISNIKADKFYLQQSWDERRRVELSMENTQQTDIYYLPGLFFAKLIADTTVLAQVPVHIKTDDWFVQSKIGGEEKKYDKNQWSVNGALEPSLNDTEKSDLNNQLSLAIYNSKDFNTDGDNFAYSSSFKMDTISAVQCPKVSIIIKGDTNYFIVQLMQKGCESDAYLKLSERQISGKTTDLTMLGTDVYQWQNVVVSTKDKVLTMTLNGDEIYQNSYQEPIGAIKEITYVFSGWGGIDNVELKDENGTIVFADSFD